MGPNSATRNGSVRMRKLLGFEQVGWHLEVSLDRLRKLLGCGLVRLDLGVGFGRRPSCSGFR